MGRLDKTCLLGVDIGTMGTKAALYDLQGQQLGAAFEESVLLYPRPGWVEQRPDDIFGSVVRTIRAAVAESGVAPGCIAGIALDGQMGGVCTIDADWGTPTHYDSWLDNRCAGQLPALKRHEDAILATSGCVPSYNHGPKILYWRDEQPEAWRRIRSFLPPAPYVAGRLAGLRGAASFMDRTYLNFTPFADTARGCWNTDLLEAFGLDEAKLPRIVEPTEIIGTVSREAAALTGLLEGTPIAAGCGDQAANVLGAGIVAPGMVFDTAGTASVLSTVIDRFETDRQYKTLMTCPHVVPGLYYAMAYVAGGGLNLRWFRDAFATAQGAASDGAAYRELDARAADVPAGADDLFFIPHMGGRNTPNNTSMRGAFFGLTWRHGQAQIFRAIMESIAYEYSAYLRSVRAIAPELAYRRVLNIGGGARSEVFRQIKADVLGLDYERLDREEFGTLGSALVAGKAVGVFADLSATAMSFNKPLDERITPNPAVREEYERRAAFYGRLLNGSESLFQDLQGLREAHPPSA
jgi:xylulokinase